MVSGVFAFTLAACDGAEPVAGGDVTGGVIVVPRAPVAADPPASAVAGNTVSAMAGLLPSGSVNCSYTDGFWKNHPGLWPRTRLGLGRSVYNQESLLAILDQPDSGNGLVALAQQLITARLNVLMGAAPLGIEGALAQADELIGVRAIPPVGTAWLPPATTSALTEQLAAFSAGKVGPGHCQEGSPIPNTPSDGGGGLQSLPNLPAAHE